MKSALDISSGNSFVSIGQIKWGRGRKGYDVMSRSFVKKRLCRLRYKIVSSSCVRKQFCRSRAEGGQGRGNCFASLG